MSRHADTVLSAMASADPSALISAWRRSVGLHGLDPDDPARPARDAVRLREEQQRSALLIAVATPYLDRLHATLDDPEAMIWLGNDSAMVVCQRTGRRYDAWRRKAPLALGSYYGESIIGTCALGTCLAEQRSIILGPGQHFLASLHAVTGIAAPIYGPDGAILGSIGCVYTDPEQRGFPARLVLQATIAVARRIGLELFAAAFPRSRLVMASSDGRKFNAVLAVDSDDRVVGATHAARELLDITDERLAVGLGSRDLFESSIDLAQAKSRLIAQTMLRHANNRSAVAKALGISRSTLYRKLGDRPPGLDDTDEAGET